MEADLTLTVKEPKKKRNIKFPLRVRPVNKISLLLLILLTTLFLSILIFFRTEIAVSINHNSAQLAYKYNNIQAFTKIWELSINNPILQSYVGEDINAKNYEELNATYLNILAEEETSYFSTVERYTEDKIDVLKYETVVISGPEFIRDRKYKSPGKDGFKKYLLSKISLTQPWNYQEKLVKEELVEEVQPITEHVFTGDKTIEELKSELNEKIKASYAQVPGNPSVFEITLTSTEYELQENETNIKLGSVRVSFEGCNYYISLPLFYSTTEHTYIIDSLDQVTRYECAESVYNSNIVEMAMCEDCTAYPIGKSMRLRRDYTPSVRDLSAVSFPGMSIHVNAYDDLIKMLQDLSAAGINYNFTSSYRSYDNQVNTFTSWVNGELAVGHSYEQAVLNANVYSAYPGFSEHQLGTAIDINSPDCSSFDGYCYHNENIWNWLADNSWKYGFVLSYPQGTQDITGYTYEPWHFRWLGKELAKEFIESPELVPEVWLRERLK